MRATVPGLSAKIHAIIFVTYDPNLGNAVLQTDSDNITATPLANSHRKHHALTLGTPNGEAA